VKYAFIAQNKAVWPVKIMCKVLKVPRSGFYASQKTPSEAAQKRAQNRLDAHALLDLAIAQEVKQCKGRYGRFRLTLALKKTGI
jgi:putative transposase